MLAPLLLFHLLRFVSGLNEHYNDSGCVSAEEFLVDGLALLQIGMDTPAAISASGGGSRMKSDTWDKLKDKHLYVVGVYHKAGSHVLRLIMRKTFDELGADYSCRECPSIPGADAVMTSAGSSHMEGNRPVRNQCSDYPDSPIRWNNCNFPAEDLLADRGLAGAKGMRAVRIIRDPFQMVASAYCYHHAGNEPFSPFAPRNIMVLNATEGVPLTAKHMLRVINSMVKAHAVADGRDTYTVVYERLTNSSSDFDATVGEMFDFLFADLITSEDRERIEMVAKTEDMNSEHFDGGSGSGHVSDDDCKEQATAALQLMPAALYSLYQEYRAVLGYV
jgi:hypothetical protein